MANEALYYGTGRRKNAVARVRLVPGTGKVTVNGREAMDYFGRQALIDDFMAPFKVTDTEGHFDVIARLNGGGISGQAGALRHGGWRLSSGTQEGWLPHARPTYGRAQEVRSAQGPQAPAVLEALILAKHIVKKGPVSNGSFFLHFGATEKGLSLFGSYATRKNFTRKIKARM